MRQLSQLIVAGTVSFILMSAAVAEAPSADLPPLAAKKYYAQTDMVIKMDNQTPNILYVKATMPSTFAKIDGQDIAGDTISSTYTIFPGTTKTFTIVQMEGGYVQHPREFEIFSNSDIPEDAATYHFAVNQSMNLWNDQIAPASLSSYAVSPASSSFEPKINFTDLLTTVTIVPKASR